MPLTNLAYKTDSDVVKMEPRGHAGRDDAVLLGGSGALEIDDVVSCPGTDSCKLGITSSMGLNRAIQERIEEVVPSIQPFSEVLDSVAYRDDLEGFALNPSWGTDLGAITKAR